MPTMNTLRKKPGKQPHSQYPQKNSWNKLKEVKDLYNENYKTFEERN
jgi:hypothetical protein